MQLATDKGMTGKLWVSFDSRKVTVVSMAHMLTTSDYNVASLLLQLKAGKQVNNTMISQESEPYTFTDNCVSEQKPVLSQNWPTYDESMSD